ncbi:MAG: YihY/virulence factor BrkB family protein [Terriglobales bacterium]
MQTLWSNSPPRYSRLRHTASFLAATETHTFASSVACNALLSFFPFIVLLLTLCRNFLGSPRLYQSLLQLLRAYLPVSDRGASHTQSFIIRNLQVIVEQHSGAQLASLLILVVTCTGVFLPLEVALNHIWGARRNRNYFHNWLVAIGLALGCGTLGMLSVSFTALTETYSQRLYHFLGRLPLLQARPVPLDVVSIALVRAGAVPFTIAIFFVIYWQLPNQPVSARRVLPAAITAGLLWEVSKYIYILLLPWLGFEDVYGPFAISVSLLIWAYVSALILLTCAEIAAAAGVSGPPPRPPKRGQKAASKPAPQTSPIPHA